MTFQMNRSVWAVFAMAWILFLASCSQKAAGDFRQDCYPNGTCNAGLECVGGTCVRVDADPAPEGGSANAPATARGVDPAHEPAAPSAQLPSTPPAAPPAQLPSTPPAAPPAPSSSLAELELLNARAAVEEAAAVYRRHYDAWNRFDAQTYFSNYLPRLTCYYNEANYDAQRLQSGSRGRHFTQRSSTRLQIGELELVAQGGDEVAFIDRGTYTEDGRTRDHEKLIVMKRVAGAWRIAVEVSRSAHGCYDRGFPPERRTPARVTCREYLACFAPCEGMRNEDARGRCYRDCYERMNNGVDCIPTYNERRQPCEAASECHSLCGTMCEGWSCNSEMECLGRCEERFASSCPQHFR